LGAVVIKRTGDFAMASSGHNNDSSKLLVNDIKEWLSQPEGDHGVAQIRRTLNIQQPMLNNSERCKQSLNQQLHDNLIYSREKKSAPRQNNFSIPEDLYHLMDPAAAKDDLSLNELLGTQLGPSDTIATLINQSRNLSFPSQSCTSTYGFVSRYQSLCALSQDDRKSLEEDKPLEENKSWALRTLLWWGEIAKYHNKRTAATQALSRQPEFEKPNNDGIRNDML
jgi:hypothetical protein